VIITVPMVEWEKALYNVLVRHIEGYPIINSMAPSQVGEMPAERWCNIGAYTDVPAAAKIDAASHTVTTTIDVYSSSSSKQSLNEMLSDIVTAVHSGKVLDEYIMENYILLSVGIASIEAFEVDFVNGKSGHQGSVRVIAEINQKFI